MEVGGLDLFERVTAAQLLLDHQHVARLAALDDRRDCVEQHPVSLFEVEVCRGSGHCLARETTSQRLRRDREPPRPGAPRARVVRPRCSGGRPPSCGVLVAARTQDLAGEQPRSLGPDELAGDCDEPRELLRRQLIASISDEVTESAHKSLERRHRRPPRRRTDPPRRATTSRRGRSGSRVGARARRLVATRRRRLGRVRVVDVDQLRGACLR